jgi:hypothetical protein
LLDFHLDFFPLVLLLLLSRSFDETSSFTLSVKLPLWFLQLERDFECLVLSNVDRIDAVLPSTPRLREAE